MIKYESPQCLVSDCSDCEGCIIPGKSKYEIALEEEELEFEKYLDSEMHKNL